MLLDSSRNCAMQLRKYISRIASMYKDNPFHNFRHASHVAMSMMKLLSRIVAASHVTHPKEGGTKAATLHDNTYGITSDAICQFAVILAALIHDVDHRGVANNILIKEQPDLGKRYKNKRYVRQSAFGGRRHACRFLPLTFRWLATCII